jgi:hypothetical protein
MFDYQAGEKYKLTLIMVAVAGFMAGMFFSFLMMPNTEAPRQRQRPAYMDDPDVSGRSQSGDSGAGQAAQPPPEQAPQNAEQAAQAVDTADPVASLNLVQQWLPLAWDLSAGSAKGSQARAIQYMTPDCADAYRKNIWTVQLAQQIDTCGIKSSFKTSRVAAGNNQSDGSIIVFVDGEQILSVPGKGSRARQVKLEYLVRSTPDGLRIAGISEGGKKS